jgi:hypothetical protein
MLNANSSTHPLYEALSFYWEKYRLTYEGGQDFITRYLQKFSVRESDADFEARKLVTYCPAHAKAAINDIKNALFQRAVDIKRTGGPVNFLYACDGTDASGVDKQGNTMNSFIGRLILPELLTMAKTGVWIDKPAATPLTRADQYSIRPYVYQYRTEDIRNWSFDQNNRLMALVLRDHIYMKDQYGLPTLEVERFRFAWIDDKGVQVMFFDTNGAPTNKEGTAEEIVYTLNLPEIPFAFFEINTSLLTDVADYQVAMLNLASSDIGYILKANYPFYTEQYNPNMELQHLLRGGQTLEQKPDGTAAEASQAKTPEARVGTSQGRRYPTGTDRPGFINPSSEPLKVSMEKQSQLEQEIRRLINLNVSNISPTRSSAESKAFDERGLESGLSYIALELEYGERKIAQIWAEYEHSEEVTRIKYPERYSIKTDEERNKEADGLEKSVTASPSLEYKKATYKEAVMVRIGHRIAADVLEKILNEIDAASEIVLNQDALYLDLENGLVSTALASEIRGYPKGESEKAAVDHEQRLTRIAIAQSKGAAAENPAARGVLDAAGDSKGGAAEKKEANDNTQKDRVIADNTRGKGRKSE